MTAQDPTENLDILWKSSLLLRSPRPSWSGMMQFFHHGDHPGKSTVIFLPIIDMNPSNCVAASRPSCADELFGNHWTFDGRVRSS